MLYVLDGRLSCVFFGIGRGELLDMAYETSLELLAELEVGAGAVKASETNRGPIGRSVKPQRLRNDAT